MASDEIRAAAGESVESRTLELWGLDGATASDARARDFAMTSVASYRRSLREIIDGLLASPRGAGQ